MELASTLKWHPIKNPIMPDQKTTFARSKTHFWSRFANLIGLLLKFDRAVQKMEAAERKDEQMLLMARKV